MIKSRGKQKNGRWSIMTCKWYNVCPIKRFTDQGLLEEKWVNEYCLKGNKDCVRYQMEEKGEYHPDYMLPNGQYDETLRKKLRNQ